MQGHKICDEGGGSLPLRPPPFGYGAYEIEKPLPAPLGTVRKLRHTFLGNLAAEKTHRC